MALFEDDDVIEALAADAAEEAFTGGVHKRRAFGGLQNVNARAFGDAVKLAAELGVAITDDELGPSPNGVSCRNCWAVQASQGSRGTATWTTSLVFTSTTKKANNGRNQTSWTCRKSQAQTVWLARKAFQLCPSPGGRTARMCRWMERLATRMPSLSNSPRMRSAPPVRL